MRYLIPTLIVMVLIAPDIYAQRLGKPTTGVIIKKSVGEQSDGRHGEYTKQFARNKHYRTAAATYFGGKDMEEFIAAGGLKDGRIVAIGNAWGPSFPQSPRAIVIGRGKHHGKKIPLHDKTGPARGSAYQTGFFVVYSKDLKKILQVIRFAWGVGSISAAIISNDGENIIIAGQCGDNFLSMKGKLGKIKYVPYSASNNRQSSNRKKKRKSQNPRDIFIASVTPKGKFNWTVILEKATISPAQIFTDSESKLWFDSNGLFHIDEDGKNLTKFADRKNGRTVRWLGVHPNGDAAYYGGDRNTHTGAEPWRQPFIHKYEKGTKNVATFWETSPRAVGAKGDGSNLMSDSSPRTLNFLPKGNTMIITGWSDGGNTVFKRQPYDHHKQIPGKLGPGFSAWGVKGANSFTHLMIIDAKKNRTLAYGSWSAYTPSWFGGSNNHTSRPNAASIMNTTVTKTGFFAFTGKAATGLIQTPGAYWQDSKDGSKYGGEYITIFDRKIQKGMFSSYLPGSHNSRVDHYKDFVLVTSTTTGDDGRKKPTESIAVNAAQPKFGGTYDAHIIMLIPPR